MRKHIADRDILPAFQNRRLNKITADDLCALCNKVRHVVLPPDGRRFTIVVKRSL